MSGKKILHMYAGTSGAAGLYMHEIYESLNLNFDQRCIVNFYYPFKYGVRYFYKLTELSGINPLKNYKYLRYALRYLELIFGLARSVLYILKFKPDVINYNLTGQNYIELFFLRLIKKFSNARLVLTLHDVIPFSSVYFDVSNSKEARQLFIDEADIILIHNENSFNDLIGNFSIGNSHVLMHDFPIMDAKLLMRNVDISSVSEFDEPYTFLFIGHGRSEKGLDILVDAWVQFFANDTRARLIVAGNISFVSEIYSRLSCFANVLVKSHFVSDDEYFSLIRNSNCLVLPYKTGTNSGIPSTAFSLDTDVICSDIPMFVNNKLIPSESFFYSENVESLSKKMFEKIVNSSRVKNGYKESLNNYRFVFCRDINATYEKIIEI